MSIVSRRLAGPVLLVCSVLAVPMALVARLVLDRAVYHDLLDFQRNAAELHDDLVAQGDALAATAREYAGWNDTYALTPAGSSEYVDLNLSFRTYVNNRWDHVVVFDATGQVLIARSADRRAMTVGPTPNVLVDYLAALAVRQTGHVVAGWGIVLEPRPLWVAVHSVLDSHLRGPPRGHFLVVRELPADFIRAWEAKYRVRLTIAPPPARAGRPAGQGPALWELHRPTWADAEFPAGEIDLVDPLGEVQGLIQMESLRPHLRDARRQLLTILPVVGLCVALALGAGLYFGRRHDREALYESVAAVTTDAVILVDHRGRVLEFNSGARSMFGYEPGDIVGQTLDLILPHGAVMPAEGPATGPRPPTNARRRDGSEFPADVSLARIRSGREVITAVSLRDLSDRVAREQARVTQGHRLDLALRAANAGTWRWNQAKRETWWSDDMYRLHGLSPRGSTPTEADWLGAIHPDDRDRVAAETQAAGPLGRVDMHYRVLLPGGVLRWLHNLGEAERDPDGRAAPMWNGIIMDVTERQEAAERLRMNEQRYRAIIENQEDAVCRWLPDTTLTFANGRYRELFGIPDGDLQGRRWINYVPEGERADVTRTYEELVRQPQNLTYEHSVQLANGQTRWVLWVDVPLLDNAGVCREFQSVGRDITERKLAEQALRESEERYRRIVDTAREGIWMLDAQMKTTFANQRMAELLGLSVTELSGRSLLDFVEPASREEACSHFEQCRAGLLHQCDLHLRLPDGSTLWTLVSANPIHDAAGVSVGTLALVTDITDRKGMEADLQAREALFRTVFESSPLGIALLSLDDTRRRVNPALARMLGYTVEEMEARSVAELTHTEDQHADAAQFHRLVAGEIDHYSLEKRLLHRDGSAVWVRLNCSLTRGAQPQVVGLVEDISQRRTTESALRTLFERTALATGDRFFQQLVSHLAGVLEVDAAFCNEVQSAGQLRCLALYQVNGRHGHVHQAIAGSPCARLLEGQTCLHQEGADHECPVFRQLSGQPARSFMGVPIMGGNGQVMGSVGVLHSAAFKNPDMMREILQVFALRAAAELERRRRDEEVRALTADLEQRVAERTAQMAVQALAMDSTMEGMSVLSNDRYIYMNEPHAAMYGFTPAELMDKTWRALYSPEEQARLEREAFPVLQRDGRWRGEVKGQRKNGELFDAEISLVATSDGHLVCSCRDITVSHAARELLNQRSQVLERATRAKDEFLAAMSHELRTPLAGILMASESLRGNVYGPLNDKQSVMLGHVEESGKHLLELINDILDLSKIEAGKVDLNPEPISAGSLCAAVVRMIRHPAAEKKLQVSVEVDPPNLVLDADPRRLKQMLLNLLGNAVKFTPEGGGIGLRVTRSTDREQILLTVSDTGIGIAPKDFHKVFQPFTQIDSSLARRFGGTGLGLALVLRMAELHGGGISLQSQPGQGSRFTIHLPAAGASPDPAATATQPGEADAVVAGSGYRVLVVDDNEITLGLIADYLERHGYRIDRARSGTEALMTSVNQVPDVILLDVQMPGMDGFEVTRALRSQPNRQLARVPIVALTALAMPGDRERCLMAGMTEYLTKPVRLAELMALVQRLCRDGRGGAAS